MFDINFFRNTYPFKQEIVSGSWKAGDVEKIFTAMEHHRNVKPFLFNIETTNNCNMTCVMCPRTTEMTRKIQNMDMNLFSRVADQISPHEGDSLQRWADFVSGELKIQQGHMGENPFYFFVSSQSVTMHGYGEPLFDPLLKNRIKALSDKGIPTYFSCNPSNINLKKIEALFDAGLSFIKFSIDSMSSEKMKEIRGSRADLGGATKKMFDVLSLKERGHYPVSIIACMIKLSSDQNSEAEEFLRTWKDKKVYSYVKSLDNQWYFKEGKSERAKSHYESQYCEFPWTSLTVMVDGTVVPCTQDFNCEMPMGNVMQASLEDIWNSEGYRKFRKMHITGNVPKEYRCKERCDLKLVADYLI